MNGGPFGVLKVNGWLDNVLLGLPSLLVRDPPPGALEVLLLHAFQEAEKVETGRPVVHEFDSMMVP
ncbi:hypothetical protein [Streptomyces sp. CPS1]